MCFTGIEIFVNEKDYTAADFDSSDKTQTISLTKPSTTNANSATIYFKRLGKKHLNFYALHDCQVYYIKELTFMTWLLRNCYRNSVLTIIGKLQYCVS